MKNGNDLFGPPTVGRTSWINLRLLHTVAQGMFIIYVVSAVKLTDVVVIKVTSAEDACPRLAPSALTLTLSTVR